MYAACSFDAGEPDVSDPDNEKSVNESDSTVNSSDTDTSESVSLALMTLTKSKMAFFYLCSSSMKENRVNFVFLSNTVFFF